MAPLEEYYSGDRAWRKFVAVCDERREKSSERDRLVSVLRGHKDLAKAIECLVAEPFSWIETPIPALDGLSPLKCLESTQGIRRLRECLMRFPC